MLKGMYTNRTGIIEVDVKKYYYTCTDLERTLLDMVVRPSYAGGSSSVLIAFKNALSRKLSVAKLIEYLAALDYIYPYHQSVGFYLGKTGFKGPLLNHLRELPRQFDFYLDYEMKQKSYSPEWRIFYPEGL
jgi:hypothetical protein